MEILLAIVVASAVIFFGALISMGNERQRKAIDELREQVVSWAIHDLGLKRERLAREIKVDDPLGWLNIVASKICGHGLNLDLEEVPGDADAIICINRENGRQIMFSLRSPEDLREMNRGGRSRLAGFDARKRALSFSRASRVYEASVLNAGILFDLELPIAWMKLTGRNPGTLERLWIFLQKVS